LRYKPLSLSLWPDLCGGIHLRPLLCLLPVSATVSVCRRRGRGEPAAVICIDPLSGGFLKLAKSSTQNGADTSYLVRAYRRRGQGEPPSMSASSPVFPAYQERTGKPLRIFVKGRRFSRQPGAQPF